MTNQPALRINSVLDPTPFAETCRRDGVVQILVFLEPVDADVVAGLMASLT